MPSAQPVHKATRVAGAIRKGQHTIAITLSERAAKDKKGRRFKKKREKKEKKARGGKQRKVIHTTTRSPLTSFPPPIVASLFIVPSYYALLSLSLCIPLSFRTIPLHPLTYLSIGVPLATVLVAIIVDNFVVSCHFLFPFFLLLRE